MMRIFHHAPKTPAALLSIFLVFAVSTLLYAGEQGDFEAASAQNTLERWELYLKKYPRSKHAGEARMAHDDLLWEEAQKNTENPAALEGFFKRSKTPDISDKIFKLWDDATWSDAKTKGEADAYRKYILRFPGGKYVKEAKTAQEDIVWRGCKEAGGEVPCKAYLSQYPMGNHAKEAKRILSDFAYRSVREKDTIEAYEAFLKKNRSHKDAKKRLQQLRYEQAVESGSLEQWKEFYKTYRFASKYSGDKEAYQMKENAEKEIERLLYEKITAEPTLELCREYLSSYRDGPHKQQVLVKMEPCLYDRAVTDNKENVYFEYLEKYPEGYRDDEIKMRLEALIFKTPDAKEDFHSFDRYLRLSPENKDELLERMEPVMFEWAKRVNTYESYSKYMKRYPDGPHLQEVKLGIDPILYKKAQAEDWHSAYADYIKKCPDCAHVQQAKERMDWLKANKAEIEMDYPKVVEGSGYWKWYTRFKEKSGKIGFRVHGSGYIIDTRGRRWGTRGGRISRETIKVKAGGKGADDYWCRSRSHVLCNGHAVFTWTGEDAGGHSIKLEEKVKLQHSNCPGSRKKK